MALEEYNSMYQVLNKYSPMTEIDFQVAIPYFFEKRISKGHLFNQVGIVCENLAFIRKGLFRIFLTKEHTHEEHNLYFFMENEFLVSIKSFLTQTPCQYTIEALEEAELIQIRHCDLMEVYKKSHSWESFGRKLAEEHFMFLQKRTESLLMKSAQERYEDMLSQFPNIINRVPLYHLSSYLGMKAPSLSRIRKNIFKP